MTSTKKKIKKKTAVIKPAVIKPPARVPLRSYDVLQRTHERRQALQKDTANWGILKIMKQLSLVREAQQWNPRIHDLISKDLEHLEKAYQRERQN